MPALDRGEGERHVGRRRGGDDDGVELGLGDHRQRLRERLGAGLRGGGGEGLGGPDRRPRPAGRRAATRGSGGGCGPSSRDRRGRPAPARARRRRRHRVASSARPRTGPCWTWRSTAARNAATTRSCSSSVRPGNIGRASVRGGRGVGHRQVGVEAALHDVFLAMDGHRVVDVGADPVGPQLGHDRVARRRRRRPCTGGTRGSGRRA